jgi:hypothetical protein
MWAHNNPFLWDIAALEEVQVKGEPGPSVQQQQHVEPQDETAERDVAQLKSTKLPEFWPHALVRQSGVPL